jgi:hypothetical protein
MPYCLSNCPYLAWSRQASTRSPYIGKFTGKLQQLRASYQRSLPTASEFTRHSSFTATLYTYSILSIRIIIQDLLRTSLVSRQTKSALSSPSITSSKVILTINDQFIIMHQLKASIPYHHQNRWIFLPTSLHSESPIHDQPCPSHCAVPLTRPGKAPRQSSSCR